MTVLLAARAGGRRAFAGSGFLGRRLAGRRLLRHGGGDHLFCCDFLRRGFLRGCALLGDGALPRWSRGEL